MTASPQPFSQQTLDLLQKAQEKLEAQKRRASEPIAIIGMGCRLPGADDPQAFCDLLYGRGDAITEIPADRWDVDAYYSPEPTDAPTMYTRRMGVISDPARFDPLFFGISPREAERMDPQQRLLLEICWQALEHAGIAPNELRNSATGVFVGMSSFDYWLHSSSDFAQGTTDLAMFVDHHASLGNMHSVAVGRVSYTLGLQGPNFHLDTACSSSLVALHQACHSLRTGEADLALAGGINLILSPMSTIVFCKITALSRQDRCAAFDAAADGYMRGEGCGILVLKRLSDALADRDKIWAVIRGSAINHDGRSNGLTAPSVAAQEKVIRQALKNAKVQPHEVQYVEAHGTGTPLGDPIEIEALGEVFGNRTQPLLVGSVKTNIGHLEAAAGVASLIKVIWALQAETIPPQLHFQTPNPYIDWQTLPIQVVSQATPWAAGKRIAGVSSFGISGTNAHVIVEAAPESQEQKAQSEPSAHLLTLSARREAALPELAQRYADYLHQHPQVALGDLCYTTHVGRSHFEHRLSVVAESPAQLQAKLATYGNGKTGAGIQVGHVPEQGAGPRIAFLFTGQGAQYVGMGRELYETQPLFRSIIDRCDVALQQCLGRSLIELLYPTGPATHNDLIDSHPCAQAANFALECALAELWKAWGVTPALVLGHSLGDFAAAYTAGVLTLEEGLRLVTKRGQLMEQAKGAMLSVLAAEAEVAPFVAAQADVAIGVINGPASVVISGALAAVDAVNEQLQAAGFKTKRLEIPVAAHSPLLAPVLDAFEAAVRQVSLAAPQLAVVSSMTGKLVAQELTDPRYWRQHLYNPVRFGDGLATLHEQGCTILIEIGPKSTLLGIAGQVIESHAQPTLLPSLRAGQRDWQEMLTTLGALYTQGVAIDWATVDQGDERRKVALPTYPFQRQRYWINRPPQRKASAALRPLIDKQIRLPLQKQTVFEQTMRVESLPFLADHLVFGEVVAPGAYYVSLALSGAELLFQGAACEVQDLIFTQPLVLCNDEARTVQLIITAPEDGARRTAAAFQIISFPATESETPSDELITHASGRLSRWRQPTPMVSLTTLQARCHTPFALAELSAAATAVQIELGPSFQWFDQVWLGEQEALSRLQMPTNIESVQGYRLFPGLVDAGFQLAGIVLAAVDQRTAGETLLPFALDSLVCYGPTDHQDLWCHARRLAERVWDFTLFNTAGQVVAEIKGFQVRAALASAMQGSKLRTDWLYDTEWVQHSLRPATPPAHTPERWLIFGAGELAVTLATQLAAAATPTILVAPGDAYTLRPAADAGLLQLATVDPLAVASFGQLLAALPTPNRREPGALRVLYAWGMDDALAQADIPDQTVRLSAALLHLAQALTEQLATAAFTVSLAIVTQCCPLVTIAPAPVDQGEAGQGQRASAGALWGLGGVIATEHPELHCVRVDIDGSDPAQIVHFLRNGVATAADQETQLAYRQGNCYVPRLQRFLLDTYQPAAPHSIRRDASYLITGGLGALGLQVARWLVDQGAQMLVLVSRRPPTDAAVQAQLQELTQRGAQLLLLQADIANRTEVARVLQTIAAQCAPLSGIVHAAGVLEDGVLAQIDQEHLARVLAPKVNGAWHLHTLTQTGNPLDFFVCFSSLSALLGSPGQGSYAAANAFLDALCQERYRQGLPALSINWGVWREVGMVARMAANQQARIATAGLGTIPTQQGLDLLATLLTTPVAQAAVFPMQWARYQEQGAGGHVPAFLRNFVQADPRVHQVEKRQNLRTTLAKVSRNEGLLRLTSHLQAELAQVLRLAELPLPYQGFFDLGMDSLLAVELRNRLQTDLDLTLSSTILFKYPTIQDLADYLSGQISREETAVAASPALNHNEPALLPSQREPATTWTLPASSQVEQALSQLEALLKG